VRRTRAGFKPHKHTERTSAAKAESESVVTNLISFVSNAPFSSATREQQRRVSLGSPDN
jgi:hypothetical protein